MVVRGREPKEEEHKRINAIQGGGLRLKGINTGMRRRGPNRLWGEKTDIAGGKPSQQEDLVDGTEGEALKCSGRGSTFSEVNRWGPAHSEAEFGKKLNRVLWVKGYTIAEKLRWGGKRSLARA